MSDKTITRAESPTQRALILICEKCGRKLSFASEENPSKTLQKEIKRRAKALFGKKQVRPVTTSCLDICPKGKIAVSVVAFERTPEFFETELGDPEVIAEEVLKRIF